MLYRNISKKQQLIVVRMNKTFIQPGDTINMTPHDINHSGSGMRFFENVEKANAVKEQSWDKPTEEKTMNQAMEEKNLQPEEKSDETVNEPPPVEEKVEETTEAPVEEVAEAPVENTASEQPEQTENTEESVKEEAQTDAPKQPEKENKDSVLEETTN